MVRPGGGRMAEDHRKQNVSRTWRASPSGISACFPENPTGRLLRNHSRFHGVVSADPAGLFRAEGELRQILGDGSAKVFCAKSPAAHGKGPPPGCFRVTGRLSPWGDDRMPGTRTASAKRWKRIPAIGKNACAIYKRIRLIYTTHMGKNGRGSIRRRIGRAKPSPVGGERMRRRQIASNRIFIRKRN